ncbi:MAG: TolC family protein [Gemmatimonadetes bacterium]|nr:TolC family protein [Gemmatimonadota bacterium]NIR80797.1 TolC family protein [Gemmatimonadota bacterium]NIT89617.1 TolC family protein [Gemmatimonadota bacterium]NIU33397.1 TolC family protein [Gemmatimonadota bacterium]NIU37689.1 TolC family protein [Gemmatimonadota bacterium]
MTSTDEARILQGNDQFPFNFEQQPLSMSLRVSVPVFQGFTRQRRVEEARVQARNAEENRRAEELRLRTVVTRAYGNLEAAHRIVTIEERNRQVAEQQLELARERYRMGAAPFLELLDAQSSMATADRDYLNALYDFHGALAQLEQASGRDLRPETAVREVDRPGSSVPTGDGSGGDSGSHPEEAR